MNENEVVFIVMIFFIVSAIMQKIVSTHDEMPEMPALSDHGVYNNTQTIDGWKWVYYLDSNGRLTTPVGNPIHCIQTNYDNGSNSDCTVDFETWMSKK